MKKTIKLILVGIAVLATTFALQAKDSLAAGEFNGVVPASCPATFREIIFDINDYLENTASARALDRFRSSQTPTNAIAAIQTLVHDAPLVQRDILDQLNSSTSKICEKCTSPISNNFSVSMLDKALPAKVDTEIDVLTNALTALYNLQHKTQYKILPRPKVPGQGVLPPWYYSKSIDLPITFPNIFDIKKPINLGSVHLGNYGYNVDAKVHMPINFEKTVSWDGDFKRIRAKLKKLALDVLFDAQAYFQPGIGRKIFLRLRLEDMPTISANLYLDKTVTFNLNGFWQPSVNSMYEGLTIGLPGGREININPVMEYDSRKANIAVTGTIKSDPVFTADASMTRGLPGLVSCLPMPTEFAGEFTFKWGGRMSIQVSKSWGWRNIPLTGWWLAVPEVIVPLTQYHMAEVSRNGLIDFSNINLEGSVPVSLKLNWDKVGDLTDGGAMDKFFTPNFKDEKTCVKGTLGKWTPNFGKSWIETHFRTNRCWVSRRGWFHVATRVSCSNINSASPVLQNYFPLTFKLLDLTRFGTSVDLNANLPAEMCKK